MKIFFEKKSNKNSSKLFDTVINSKACSVDKTRLKKSFVSASENRPYIAVLLDGDLSDIASLDALMLDVKKSGWRGVVMHSCDDTHPRFGTEEFCFVAAEVNRCAERHNLSVLWMIDCDVLNKFRNDTVYFDSHPEDKPKELCKRSVLCSAEEPTRFMLDCSGKTMALTAVNVDSGEVVDLTDKCPKEVLDGNFDSDSSSYLFEWMSPEGNWELEQYYCRTVNTDNHINVLNYNASLRYIEYLYERMKSNKAVENVNSHFELIMRQNLCFYSTDYVMWDDNFNDTFEKIAGYRPTSLYPALFSDVASVFSKGRALMFSCRSRMLSMGYLKAMNDFIAARREKQCLFENGSSDDTTAGNLQAVWSAFEYKSSLPTPFFGDHIIPGKNENVMPLVDMTDSYMYGINGLKFASGAVENHGISGFGCTLFIGYDEMNSDVLFRETMNVFVRGANVVLPYGIRLSSFSNNAARVKDIPKDFSHETDSANYTVNERMKRRCDRSLFPELSQRNPLFSHSLGKYTDLLARMSLMSMQGTHVSDIAVIYPISSLHAQTYLHDYSITKETYYPSVPENTDYMTIVNILLNYCGHDVTVVHPEIFRRKLVSEGTDLVLEFSKTDKHRLELVILPGNVINGIGFLRKLKEYFNAGGNIIATTHLPVGVIESADNKDFDCEADEIIRYIFGVGAYENSYLRDFYENKGANGGKAFFIPASSTEADGTLCLSAPLISDIIDNKLCMHHDVIIKDMPKIASNGTFNMYIAQYVRMSVMQNVGGVFNYIHRSVDEYDIYMFSNTTNKDYDGSVMLRGLFRTADEWDPMSGSVKSIPVLNEKADGVDYTSINLELSPGECRYIVCT